MKKVLAFFLAISMVVALVGVASAEEAFPCETITLVCPFSAGGGTDIGARNMATALQEILGVNVVVENQTGSGGWVAWTDLITGDYSDGYTIGLINHNFVFGKLDPVNPREYGLDDVKVLCNQVVDYDVLAIRADETRFTDINSFIEYTQNNDTLISGQTASITDGEATKAQWFIKTFGSKIVTVPVDGASDSRAMFLAGDTDFFFGSISDMQADYNAGNVKVLCLFANERSDFMPDVPTIEEATGKKLVTFAARGYFYPASVSDEKVEIIRAALLKAMELDSYKESMTALGLKLDNTSGDAYKELLASQMDTRLSIWG